MRIIAGSARGCRLETLPGEQTRPTSERAKEAIFSMLQFELAERRVLDLFAGSGQLALEALSRGAAEAVLCDASREATDILRRNVERTHLADRAHVRLVDALAYLGALRGETFDLVFLDPPYAARLICPALRGLLSAGALRAGALLVCESAEADIFAEDDELRARFVLRKTAKYGVAHMTVLRYDGEGEV